MKLDPVEIKDEINKTTKNIQNSADKMTQKPSAELSDKIILELQNTMPKLAKNIQNGSNS
jgi:hypothetical protein